MTTQDGNNSGESPSCLLRLRDALEYHSLNLCDVEPEVLRRFCTFSTSLIAINNNQEYENGIQRVVRLTLTNKELEKHGLEPLLFEDASHNTSVNATDTNNNVGDDGGDCNISNYVNNNAIDKDKEDIEKMLADISKKAEDLTEEDIKLSSDIGLTPQEYVTIKGEYGMVMGLQLEKISYEKILKTCRSKPALKLRVDKNACKDFLCKKIIALARLRLRYPNTIPFFKTNTNHSSGTTTYNNSTKKLINNINLNNKK
jgi:hypothetical protein